MVPIIGANPQHNDHRPMQGNCHLLQIIDRLHNIIFLKSNGFVIYQVKIPQILLRALYLNHCNIRLRSSTPKDKSLLQYTACCHRCHLRTMPVLIGCGHNFLWHFRYQCPVNLFPGILRTILETHGWLPGLNGLVPDSHNTTGAIFLPKYIQFVTDSLSS